MKKTIALILALILMFSLCSCSAVTANGETSYGSANITKSDADVRYEQGYYKDMYHKFDRIDVFAKDKFGYTVRVKENADYQPLAVTGDLFTDYNTYLNSVVNTDMPADYYFNYLSNTSYTYTFMNADQCADVFDAYYNMLCDASYTPLEVKGTDASGQPIEFYMQAESQSEPFDILILYNEVGSKTITVGFAPEYNPYRYQVDTLLDNENINNVSTLGYVGIIGGAVFVLAAVIFAVLMIVKKKALKRK